MTIVTRENRMHLIHTDPLALGLAVFGLAYLSEATWRKLRG